MTSIPLKEKITAIKIIHEDTSDMLATVNTIDFIPTSINAVAVLDFFNIEPNRDYVLVISLVPPHKEIEQIVKPIRIKFPSEQVSYFTQEYGKANGAVDFQLPVLAPGDCKIILSLQTISGEELDSYSQYFHFARG